MTSLETLEQRFLAHVRGGEAFPKAWCAQGIVGSDIGLAIYANAYHSRLREALEADHPALSSYLGDALWARFCAGYIENHPSRVRSLRHFGASAPEWLGNREPFSAHPVIAELAAFERALLDVFDAADLARISWTSLQVLDVASWPGLRIRFHPSVRWIAHATNAVAVWRALKDDEIPPIAIASATPAHLLWRDEDRVSRFRPIDATELAALQACLGEGRDFSMLCERLAQEHGADEVPNLAISLLRRWFDEGIVVGIRCRPG